jgi:hypothetical protein
MALPSFLEKKWIEDEMPKNKGESIRKDTFWAFI